MTLCYAAVVDLHTGEELTSPRVPCEIATADYDTIRMVNNVTLPSASKSSAEAVVVCFAFETGPEWHFKIGLERGTMIADTVELHNVASSVREK